MATQGVRIQETFIANTALAQYRVVALTGGKVGYPAAKAAIVGVTQIDVPAADRAVTVAKYGRVKLVATGAIAAGADLTAAADGKVATAAAGDVVIGKALEAAVANQVFTADIK